MTTDEKLQIIKTRLDNEYRFVYSPDPKEGFEESLKRNDRFKQNRLEAERAAMQEFRIRYPNNETELDLLVDKELVHIWDLRDTLERIREEK
jgi:hypothetical protein